LAAGIVWGVATVWVGYLATLLWPRGDLVYESIQVLGDGTPVVRTYAFQTVGEETFRTLDGAQVAVVDREFLTSGTFNGPLRPAGVLEVPIPWRERIAASSNFQRPQTGWYLVRDAEPLGHAYFVGYDEMSKRRIGYIARNGFRPAIPPREEWFDVGRHRFINLGWSGAVCSSLGLQFGARAYTFPQIGGDRELPPWFIFLIDGDRLLQIDLAARTAQTLLESPGMLSVAVVSEPFPVTAKGQSAPLNPATSPAPIDALAATDIRRRREPLPELLAIRMADRVVLLNPPTGAKREYVLPEALRYQILNVYALRDDQLLAQVWKNQTYYGDTDLTWLKPDGTIARQQSFSLSFPFGPSEHEAVWMATAVAPSPIAWLGMLMGYAPFYWLQRYDVPTYADALARGFGIAALPFVVVIAISIALAWLTYRLQRKYCRPATGLWTTFVLLLGLPGFIAYWLENRRAKLETCESCDQVVPRDRETCAACDAQFPTPPLVGTEIFA
jgi:hypothetical protein